METPEISIVVPSLNAKDLLSQLLPNLIPVVQNYRGGAEIIVVDDGSTDGTSPFIHSS